jgi:hypothetical protein
MIRTAPLSFDGADEQVEGMLRQGTAFALVEDAIDASHFSPHHKAALCCLPGRCATRRSSVAMLG